MHRRRIPILHALLAITGLLLICLIVFHEPLFSGEIINASDILTQQYFWNTFVKENFVTDPCFRTWLPYVNAGTPFDGGLNLFFSPVTLLTLLLLPVHIAINYEVVIYFFLCGVGMYFYMKELRVSSVSAFFAAMVLMLNGEIVTLMNAGHVNKIGAIFPMPLVFLMFERALRRRTLNAFLLAATVLGFEYWQGHIQISFYLCIGIAIYYVVQAAVILKQERCWKTIGKLTAYALIMVTIFLMLAAMKMLPKIAFAQVSERAEGVSYEFATSWSMPPEETLTYLIPGLFGLRRDNVGEDEAGLVEYWGRMPFTQTGRYFGILPLLLAIAALCFVRNRHVLTLSILALIILLMGMGRYLPTYKLLYQLPGFKQFRVPQMILFLFAFAASALSGLGLEWLLSGLSEIRQQGFRRFLLTFIGIAFCFWGITMALPHLQEPIMNVFQDAFYRKGADDALALVRFQNIRRSLLIFDMLFGASILALALRLVPNIQRWGVILAIFFVSLTDLWWFNEKFIDTVPLAGSDYVNSNDVIRHVNKEQGLYRVLFMLRNPSTYVVPNKAVLHKYFSVAGYEAVGVQQYNEYIRHMFLGSRLLDLLNVKYIALDKNTILSEEGQSIGDTFGPYKLVMDGDALLLENQAVLPRAYAVHTAYLIESAEEFFAAVENPQFNSRESVIFEEEPNVAMPPTDLSSSESRVDITQYHTRTIRMNASMATDGFVVLAEKFYPGWRAYVDGRQVPVYKANYTFQAIAVPQGEHEILFSFQPTDFILGFVITMATCIGLLAYAFVQRAHPAWLATKGESLRAFLAGRCHPKIRSILINVLLMLISLTVAATLLEIYMRQSPHFRHGGDRAPRNDENLTWEKPEGTKRVVVLGDSLTFGDGVRAPETYPAQLQNLLRTRQDGAFQVINLGIMGINTDHEALILLRENPYFGRPAMDFEPDLLVLTFCVNDLELMADPKPRPETKLLPGALEQYLRSHYKLYQFVHKRANQLLASLGVQPSYIEYLQQLYRSDTQEWQDLISYIDLIATATQEHSIPLLLVIFPSLNTLDASHPFLDLYASIREQGEQRGIEVLDLFPYFQGQDAAKLRVSLMNGHPNAEAYSIAAEAIYTTITEKGLL